MKNALWKKYGKTANFTISHNLSNYLSNNLYPIKKKHKTYTKSNFNNLSFYFLLLQIDFYYPFKVSNYLSISF